MLEMPLPAIGQSAKVPVVNFVLIGCYVRCTYVHNADNSIRIFASHVNTKDKIRRRNNEKLDDADPSADGLGGSLIGCRGFCDHRWLPRPVRFSFGLPHISQQRRIGCRGFWDHRWLPRPVHFSFGLLHICQQQRRERCRFIKQYS